MKALSQLAAYIQGLNRNLKTAVKDTADGFFEIFHSGFAMIGLAAAIVSMVLISKPELRQSGEVQLLSWLQVRHGVFSTAGLTANAEAVTDLDASERATATDPAELPKQQAAVAFWLSKKYKIAPEPLSALVAEAYAIGAKAKLEPTLILAIMAIESGFNPFAQSPVGAQGLMQVMTKVHSDKYEDFGGTLAAFDPITNLRVGVKVLQDCIAQAGSVEGGLKHYVGAANLTSDGGYANKVVAEYARLYQVAYGKPAPVRKPSLDIADSTPVRGDVPIKVVLPVSSTSLVPVLVPALVPVSLPVSLPAAMPLALPVFTPVKPTSEVSVEKVAAL